MESFSHALSISLEKTSEGNRNTALTLFRIEALHDLVQACFLPWYYVQL